MIFEKAIRLVLKALFGVVNLDDTCENTAIAVVFHDGLHTKEVLIIAGISSRYGILDKELSTVALLERGVRTLIARIYRRALVS